MAGSIVGIIGSKSCARRQARSIIKGIIVFGYRTAIAHPAVRATRLRLGASQSSVYCILIGERYIKDFIAHACRFDVDRAAAISRCRLHLGHIRIALEGFE